ncbi:hypothetical protein ACFFGT_10350 [Mucilaginibacter angelicae]|uniref:Uncharacterized protein n=1 Tax=Mucilaginibacter angelicae TaxID=869718 RepID=A0ABV6L573_9SPHI
MKKMKMSESEYKELVLADYDRQMAEHLLPSELLVPTPANIKAEIVKICEQGSTLSAGDEKILRSFVGERENAAAYRIAFQNGKADPFRQVVKLLVDRSVNTNVKYVNLMALLIGFPARPYHPSLKQIGPPMAGVMTDQPVEGPKTSQPLTEGDAQPGKGNSYKFLWLFASVIIVGMGWYLISKKTVIYNNGKEDCMIWSDDHYEPIECKDPSTAAPHYPIKHELVDHFKRITRPDTLTYQSVRKVWYSNYKGRMEFYTDSGPHPLDTNLRVLPMTLHIFEKYVLHIKN